MSRWKRFVDWCREPSRVRIRSFNPRNIVLIELSILIISLITSGTWFFQVFSITQPLPIITSISGDGTKIAYASGMGGGVEFFVGNSDETGLIQLISIGGSHRFPSISCDGSKIAFHTWTDTGLDIIVVNSDGSGETKLTSKGPFNSYLSIYGGPFSSYASISGDGTKIAFQSKVDGDEEIFVVNSDGTGLTKLTHNTATDRYASISDDGTKIAYTSNVNGDNEIFLIINDLAMSLPTPEAEFNFPIEYAAAGIVGVMVAVALVVIFFVRRK